MPKTTLIERMKKKGAPKSWTVEVNKLNLEIKKLEERNETYLNIIDRLARQVEELSAFAEEHGV